MSVDLTQVPTPCYVCEEEKLQYNLAILDQVQKTTQCKILLALKGFAMFSLFPTIRDVLKGTTASSVNEARLGYEEFGGETHLYAPAFKDDEFDTLLSYADHIVFNSSSQWNRFKGKVRKAQQSGTSIQCGLRVNPEYSEVKTQSYNPCCSHSRLGVTLKQFREKDLEGISGLHFHTHCGNNADTFERTLAVFEKKFGVYVKNMKWINFGGGHHITRSDYQIDLLCSLIHQFKDRYGVEIYLEPGEAVALNAGILVACVLDIIHNEMDIAILDTSASAHMPDVLEMPYRPTIIGASLPGIHPHTYRLAGVTCLAGDVIGDYSFPEPLQVGDKIVFEDMLHYTMVKNTTFNGIELPHLAIWSESGKLRLVKTFHYEDYKSRLS